MYDLWRATKEKSQIATALKFIYDHRSTGHLFDRYILVKYIKI